jgi:hypothetical protein
MVNITFVHQELQNVFQKYTLIYPGVLTARDYAARMLNIRYPSAMTKVTSANEDEESEE